MAQEGEVAEIETQETHLEARSSVWTFMEKLNWENKDLQEAKCKNCGNIFGAASKNGTSHLKRHISKCFSHESVSAEVHSRPAKSPRLVNPDELRKAICMFVVGGSHPFSIVEEPLFKNMLGVACPNYKVLSRHTIRRDVLKNYEEEKRLVEIDLENAPGRVFFTSDNWRNDGTQDEYICITSHWIDKNWMLQKRIIRFGALTPPFDGINIAEDVYLCLAKWKLDRKVGSFTLDNATYNSVMVNQIKKQLHRNGNQLYLSGDFFQIRCCCHIINLIVQAGLKLIDDVVDKIRAISKHFRYSLPKKYKFYAIAKETYHLNVRKRLRGDCCVRWNSTFLMLDRALYFRRAIDHVVEKDGEIKMYLLSEEEWTKLSVIHDFLKVFYDVTNEFSSYKSPTTNIYFKGVWNIQCLLLEAVNGRHEFLTSMVVEMQKKFDKYWSNYNTLLSCACVLDPRYKLKFVEYCYTTLYGETHGKSKAMDVKNVLYELLKEYGASQGGGEGGDVGDSSELSEMTWENTNFATTSSRMASFSRWVNDVEQSEVDKSPLDTYLEEKKLDHNVPLDVLSYWKDASLRHPQLGSLARDLLAIPISSVPSESAFSVGKKMVNPWRASLSSETIESCACYEDWLRAKGFNLGRSSMFYAQEDQSDSEEEELEDDG